MFSTPLLFLIRAVLWFIDTNKKNSFVGSRQTKRLRKENGVNWKKFDRVDAKMLRGSFILSHPLACVKLRELKLSNFCDRRVCLRHIVTLQLFSRTRINLCRSCYRWNWCAQQACGSLEARKCILTATLSAMMLSWRKIQRFAMHKGLYPIYDCSFPNKKMDIGRVSTVVKQMSLFYFINEVPSDFVSITILTALRTMSSALLQC